MKKFFFGVTVLLCTICIFQSIAYAAMSRSEFDRLCRRGTVSQIEEAIMGGADVNAVLGSRSVLNSAVTFNDDPEVVMTLLRHGANAGFEDLYDAVRTMDDSTYVFSALLQNIKNGAGLDINAKHDDRQTLLMQACYLSSGNIVEILLRNGADVNVKDPDGATALHKVFYSLVKPVNSDLRARAMEQAPRIVSLLLRNKADARIINKGDRLRAIDYLRHAPADAASAFRATSAYRQLEKASKASSNLFLLAAGVLLLCGGAGVVFSMRKNQE